MAIRRREFLAGLAAASGASLLAPAAARGQNRPAAELAKQPPPKFKYTKPIIDAHVHWYPPEMANLIEKEGKANGLTEVVRDKEGNVSAMLPGYHPYTGGRMTFRSDMTDPTRMLKMADDRRVDLSVLTQTNPHVVWAPAAFGLKLSQAINDSTSALHVKYPKRIMGAITLPLQDIKMSLAELERAAKLPGMRAVNVTENILGKNLSEKSLWPLYERIEALNMPIFLHNVDPISERLVEKDYTMINVLGNPFEATIAATALVLGGVMDAFPKLDVYFPHAGGFFPFVTPRMDWSMGTSEYFPRGRTNSFANLKQPRASDYRRRFHYDLIMHDPKITRMLIDLVGADRVVSGTDFPQGMGVMRPIEYVEAIPGITQKEAEIILCDAPARLLRLQT
jgi:aminocarboxymuconate-semialdehyde decarboxylase